MESSSPPTGYEFTPSQNEVLGSTARWVGYWAWFAIIAGALTALAGVFTLPAGVFNLVIGVVYVLVGLSFKGAAGSLRSVVATSGSDVAHLMSAMDNLRKAFKIMVLLLAIGLAAALVLALVGIGMATSGGMG